MAVEQIEFVVNATKKIAKKGGIKDLGWIDGLPDIICMA
jgi:hypothetical protein